MKCLLMTALLLWGIVLPAADNQSRDYLHKVETALGRIKSLQANFVEERQLKIMRHKIRFTGMIFMQAPNKLAWHVFTPLRYSCIINGSTMTQWDADSNEEMTLSANKITALQLVIRQLRYWFSGNFSALHQDFQTEVKPNSGKLCFIPRPEAPPAQFIRLVTVTLQQDLNYIRKIVIVEKNGDTMQLTFSNTIINKPLPAAAWKVRSVLEELKTPVKK